MAPNCTLCSKDIQGADTFIKDDKPFCKVCNQRSVCEDGEGVCVACSQKFCPGQKKIDLKEKCYHDTCFLCSMCHVQIGQNKCYVLDDSYVCPTCYETKVAKTCSICNQKIFGALLKNKDECYHKECIVCNSCNESLGGKYIVNFEDKKYCLECYDLHFAKKCEKCCEPISAGIQYVVYEQQNWHSDCFNCTTCSACLKGQGFNIKDSNLLCLSCSS